MLQTGTGTLLNGHRPSLILIGTFAEDIAAYRFSEGLRGIIVRQRHAPRVFAGYAIRTLNRKSINPHATR